MSKKTSNFRGNHRHTTRRVSAPARGQGYLPQTNPYEHQLAGEDAADLPQRDRDPDSYVDEEESLAGVSVQMPIPIAYYGGLAQHDAQLQTSSYPPTNYHEQQNEEHWQYQQQWSGQQWNSAAYNPANLPRGPRTTQSTHTPGTYIPVAYINDEATRNFGEVSDTVLQSHDCYLPILSRSPPAFTAAPSAATSPPKNSFAGMGGWDLEAAATHNLQYPPATTDPPDHKHARLLLGELPGRPHRSASTEARRSSSKSRDTGGSKPPASGRNPNDEARGRRHRH